MIIRGQNLTTKQIKEAPKNSSYLWCGPNISYAKHLAVYLGRDDLYIMPWYGATGFLCDLDRFRGLSQELFVIDHAVQMTETQLRFFKAHRLVD